VPAAGLRPKPGSRSRRVRVSSRGSSGRSSTARSWRRQAGSP